MTTYVSNLNERKNTHKGKDFGVEIEVEGREIFYRLLSLKDERGVDFKGWDIKQDGSLRDGAELLSRNPVPFKALDKHLSDLYNILKENKVEYKESDRTGIHLHMNMNDMSMLELVNFLCCYYVVEESLVSICGEKRQGNHFCLRAVDAEYIIERIVDSLQNNRINRLNHDMIRYSSLNLCSLFNFGTVEFRAIQTKVDFPNVVMPVASCLYALKENSRRFASPEEVINTFSGTDTQELLSILLGSSAKELSNISNIRTMLVRGVRYAQDISYCRDYPPDFSWGVTKSKSKPRTVEEVALTARNIINTTTWGAVYTDTAGTGEGNNNNDF